MAPLPALSPCDPQTFAKLLRTMRAALPMRSLDDDGGKLIAATYDRMLGSYSREALAYMVERAIAELKWFPTVAECREILADWRRDDAETKAIIMAGQLASNRSWNAWRDKQAAHQHELYRLRIGKTTQAELDELPDYTCHAAEALGYVTLSDGRWLLRQAA